MLAQPPVEIERERFHPVAVDGRVLPLRAAEGGRPGDVGGSRPYGRLRQRRVGAPFAERVV